MGAYWGNRPGRTKKKSWFFSLFFLGEKAFPLSKEDYFLPFKGWRGLGYVMNFIVGGIFPKFEKRARTIFFIFWQGY